MQWQPPDLERAAYAYGARGMARERRHVRWGGWANMLCAMTTMEVGSVAVGLALAVVVALAVVGDSSDGTAIRIPFRVVTTNSTGTVNLNKDT
jgi:hypothetical protein